MNKMRLTVAATLIVAWVGMAQAADDEPKCLAGRAKAKGTYEKCVQLQFAKAQDAGFVDSEKLAKCVATYAKAWTKLQKLTDSPTCGGLDRFADNGTTVTDRLTTLIWEKKTTEPFSGDDYGDPHTTDNGYSLTFDNDDDGSAYYDFLGKLNQSTGFENANGWRLPTLSELLTILNEPAVGPVMPGPYWSTSVDQTNAGNAWTLHSSTGQPSTAPKWAAKWARAVRGGL